LLQGYDTFAGGDSLHVEDPGFVDGGGAMAMLINCECGRVVRGENEDELVAAAEDHVNRDHPELVGKITRDDLLAMAEEE
jgi:hypothetical protein